MCDEQPNKIRRLPVPFDTHARCLIDIKIVFVQNYPPNRDLNIVCERLLHLNDDGLPGAMCWKALINLLIQVVVRYGVDPKTARILVMTSLAVMNRTVCKG